jgi:hypothetical protein
MKAHLDWSHRAFPVTLGAITLASVVALLAWDLFPNWFPVHAHDILGALPLALIAVAYLAYQAARKPGKAEVLKAVLLALAFFFWAGNQLWPLAACSTLLNDLAIALFVLDLFFVLIGWPATSPDESFGESYAEPTEDRK